MNDKLFQSEKVPEWNRRLYVRISNFTGVKVEGTFLSKWLSYTSCSLDIWDSGEVLFANEIPPIAKTNALTFPFAGKRLINVEYLSLGGSEASSSDQNDTLGLFLRGAW